MMRLALLLTLSVVEGILFSQNSASDSNPVDLVNPLMGSQSVFSLSNGNTYPAIALPWGMNFWVPQTGKMGDGWIYTYNAEKIRGFKQTHEPSPWINDYGQFSIFPETGKPQIDEEARASWFSHKAETARPYYYKVYLADYDVSVEIAPTERAASFRFTFPETDSAYILVDAFDKGSYIKILPEDNMIIGYSTKNSGGVPDNFKNYFVIRFDKPFTEASVWHNKSIDWHMLEKKDEQVGALLKFSTRRGELIHAAVASSFISPEQALLNLREIGSKDFETIKKEARETWNKQLGRIVIEGGTAAQQSTFYSCLYRTMLFPRRFYETDESGKIMHYSPYNGKVLPGYLFTDNGFWDTFRAAFPLFNLMEQELNSHIQEGLVNAYLESGWLPEWASPGHRDCMIGSNSASIIADAWLKGLRGYNIDTLYKAILKNSEKEGPMSSVGRKGVKYYNEKGYIPYNVKINENVARTLEYAYDDFAIMQLAKSLGRPKAEIQKFASRCLNYRNVYDPSAGLMRGKNLDGSFQVPFSPFKWGDAFTEGNSWHYTWSVFHDIQGLIGLMGGKEHFIEMLDSVFVLPPMFDDSYYGFPIHEIREMQIMNMGNYAHGNQPIQHMVYLYNYAGESFKTQYWVREIMDRLYTPAPDGYCGDEDNGQTSAWYVFSAMGFYPVCPASSQYVIGAPLFKKVTLSLENGNKIIIQAPENSAANRFIKSTSLNGKDWSATWLDHDELMKGAVIDFNMVDLPHKQRLFKSADFPYSYSNETNK
jgi:predicted alpha-1,2-mannosidase